MNNFQLSVVGDGTDTIEVQASKPPGSAVYQITVKCDNMKPQVYHSPLNSVFVQNGNSVSNIQTVTSTADASTLDVISDS